MSKQYWITDPSETSIFISFESRGEAEDWVREKQAFITSETSILYQAKIIEKELSGGATKKALQDVQKERIFQDEKWGAQNHEDGTSIDYKAIAEIVKIDCQSRFDKGTGTWSHILMEEVWESLAEEDPILLRKELIQVAAVAVAWVEDLDRRIPGVK